MQVTTETPRWKVYQLAQRDAFGYEQERFGVREEFEDGATRFIHNEAFNTREEAESIAARFNLNARKGQRYDNVMKSWG